MTSFVDSLRQPEYTGENRCTPCTIVNVAIAVVLSAVAGVVEVLLAPIVLAVCLLAIYFRGYLVPGTPTLTKRYFPDRVLAWFDKAPEPGETDGLQTQADTDTDTDAEADEQHEDVDPEQLLLAADAVEPCEHEDDLCLTDTFETAWWERIDENREAVDVDGLADVIGIDGEPEIEQYGDAFVLTADDQRIGQWESRAALVADVAAARTLAEQYSDWESISSQARGELLSGLRIFLERCPVCGETVHIGQETVESCCRSYEVVAASCESCEERLLEVNV
jgi:hypothetical protein